MFLCMYIFILDKYIYLYLSSTFPYLNFVYFLFMFLDFAVVAFHLLIFSTFNTFLCLLLLCTKYQGIFLVCENLFSIKSDSEVCWKGSVSCLFLHLKSSLTFICMHSRKCCWRALIGGFSPGESL